MEQERSFNARLEYNSTYSSIAGMMAGLVFAAFIFYIQLSNEGLCPIQYLISYILIIVIVLALFSAVFFAEAHGGLEKANDPKVQDLLKYSEILIKRDKADPEYAMAGSEIMKFMEKEGMELNPESLFTARINCPN